MTLDTAFLHEYLGDEIQRLSKVLLRAKEGSAEAKEGIARIGRLHNAGLAGDYHRRLSEFETKLDHCEIQIETVTEKLRRLTECREALTA